MKSTWLIGNAVLLVLLCATVVQAQKPGDCPAANFAQECPGEAVNECYDDSECGGNDKCCSDGCSLKCAAASEGGDNTGEPKVVKGEPGDPGDRGVTGGAGADGSNGARGARGPKGNAGKDGSNGK